MYPLENPVERGSEFVLKMSRIFIIIKGKKVVQAKGMLKNKDIWKKNIGHVFNEHYFGQFMHEAIVRNEPVKINQDQILEGCKNALNST